MTPTPTAPSVTTGNGGMRPAGHCRCAVDAWMSAVDSDAAIPYVCILSNPISGPGTVCRIRVSTTKEIFGRVSGIREDRAALIGSERTRLFFFSQLSAEVLPR